MLMHAQRIFEDGRTLRLQPLLFGAGRLQLFPNPETVIATEVYDYEHWIIAWHEITEWNGKGEPRGWYRHRPSNRRRPDGDPNREYIAS